MAPGSVPWVVWTGKKQFYMCINSCYLGITNSAIRQWFCFPPGVFTLRLNQCSTAGIIEFGGLLLCRWDRLNFRLIYCFLFVFLLCACSFIFWAWYFTILWDKVIFKGPLEDIKNVSVYPIVHLHLLDHGVILQTFWLFNAMVDAIDVFWV